MVAKGIIVFLGIGWFLFTAYNFRLGRMKTYGDGWIFKEKNPYQFGFLFFAHLFISVAILSALYFKK
jgi:hypothetical protein